MSEHFRSGVRHKGLPAVSVGRVLDFTTSISTQHKSGGSNPPESNPRRHLEGDGVLILWGELKAPVRRMIQRVSLWCHFDGAENCSWMVFSKVASYFPPLKKIQLMKKPRVPLPPARIPSWESCWI